MADRLYNDLAYLLAARPFLTAIGASVVVGVAWYINV